MGREAEGQMGQTLSCVFVLSPFSELQVGCGKKARGGQGWGLRRKEGLIGGGQGSFRAMKLFFYMVL